MKNFTSEYLRMREFIRQLKVAINNNDVDRETIQRMLNGFKLESLDAMEKNNVRD